MKIAVLGGTGPAGSALATRLASVGYDVVIGSRSEDRSIETVNAILQQWPDRGLSIRPATNVAAADAEVVVIATPWDATALTALSVVGSLRGKVVISMANALVRVGHEFLALTVPRGSVAAGVQSIAPDAQVAAAFHHLPARELAMIDHPVESDVLICSDHPTATEITSEIAARIPGCRPVDAGSLVAAGPIEAFTAVLLQMNTRYKTRTALRMTGLAI